MEYIRITGENIDREHICCAMSNNKSRAKKAWLKDRFAEGLVFYRSVERGKCFIEYIPAEYAWAPIHAPGYLFINCLWVAGSLKGQGYSNDLMDQCISDAEAQGCKGICILSSTKRKKEFLADPKYLAFKGFTLADTAANDIALMYLPLTADAETPAFRERARRAEIDETGWVIYYTDQCPFTDYWVPRVVSVAADHGIEIRTVHVTDRKTAQDLPAPVTMYALFKDGKFITQGIQSDKKFLKLAGVDI